MPADAVVHSPVFLDGGGEMGARIRGYDWSGHPFGAPGQWPQTLRVAVALCLHSTFPTAIYWGPELRLLYNDAWSVIPDDRHPWALGQPGAAVWPEIWDVVGPQFADVLRTGEGFSTYDQLLAIRRQGVPTETYWNYSFSPLRSEDGTVQGILNQGNETTAKVIGEAALRASEERLQMALDASGKVGTWEWDMVADRLIGDERIARLYGVDPQLARDGAPAAAFLRHIHPDDFGAFSAAMQRGIASGGVVAAEYRLVLPDGAVRWLAVQGRCRLDADGRPERFAGLSLDITDPKRNELALRRAKDEREFILALTERQRAQTDADDVMQLTADAVGRYLGVNRAGFFQVDAESIITYGACWVDGVLPPLTGSVPSAAFGTALGDTIRSGQTLVFGSPDDPVRPEDAALAVTGTRAGISVPLVRGGIWEAAFYLSHAAPRAWTPEEIALIEEVAQLSWDAVARVRAAARLRTMNASLAGEVAERTAERDRIWEVSEDILGVADLDGVWQTINPAWTRLLGWEAADIIGRSSEWLIDAAVWSARGDRLTGLRDGTVQRYEIAMRTRAGGVRTLAWTASIAGGRIYAIARDVTEERQRQAALAEAEERLRQSQKMEAVGQLTGGLAHDFNNLLTGMSGAMEMLQVRLKQGRIDDLERYIVAAQAASGRAAALTHRLLAFSRRQTLDPRPTDANRLIAEMADMIRRTVGPSVIVDVRGADDLWPALVDPNQLENALLNLCINARDAMPEGGTLTIDTGNIVLDLSDAAERDLPPGDYLTLCVTDSGTGMSPAVAARAFDPFFTTKPLGAGTGLGLSMIYGFARQSGGHVRIETEEGKGTLLCLYLPRHHGAVAPAERVAMSGIGARIVGGQTVLVVDDEPGVRMLVADVLDELGLVSIAAADGAGALTVLESDAGIDLLITDIGLPGGLNGRQVADAARAARPGLPVLFITGFAEHAVIGNDRLEEDMAIVTKPFSIELLASRIRAMIAAD